MRRLLASILSLALALGSVPAQAQTVLGRASLPATASAPTPLPSSVLPAVGSLSPALAAPSLAASLTPAAYAPVPGLEPVKPVQAAAVPVALPAAVPVAVPAPAPARDASAPAPIESLRSAASLPVPAAIFDGSLNRSEASSVEPPSDPEPAAKPARKGLLQRYRDSRKNSPPLQSAFAKGLFVASMAAAATPPLLKAAPAMKAAFALAAADALILAVIVPLSLAIWAFKKFRGPQTASKPPPSKRLKTAILVAGAVIGMGIGLAPYAATGPIKERIEARLDLGRTAEEQENVRWISGGAVEDETIKILSRNPVGRATLDSLRDRFGVIRLPTFFLSKQDDSYGEHEDFYDGIYLNASEVTGRGWTVEEFLKNPALQRQLIREMDATVLHELTHGVQGRRLPWRPAYFKNSIESEQQAFLQETLFRLAELERDPSLKNNGHDQWMLPDAAENLDKFLQSVAAMYEKNVVVGNDPDYNAYFAAQRARWPAFRVHIYEVLAARANTPQTAKMYMDKARAAAKEAGLPEPKALIVSR